MSDLWEAFKAINHYDDEIYRIDFFIFWRSIVLLLLFIVLAALTLFYVLGPMFLDIFALSCAWGALGIVIGNIWHGCKFGFSKRLLRFSAYFFIGFIAGNLIFIPNSIGFLRAFNDIKSLNDNVSIKINFDDPDGTIVVSKSGIAEFTKLAAKSKIYYVNHDMPVKEFKLSIMQRDGNVDYPATILKKYPGDIVVGVKPYLFWNNIRIPKGAVWLKKMEQEQKLKSSR